MVRLGNHATATLGSLGIAASDVPSPAPLRPQVPRPSYIPGLDGVRAFAVIAVLLYHADLPWAAGGFLGVDVFFVLSGYLITALLHTEWTRRGEVNLVGFWGRRARRLLPALFLLLAVVLAVAVIFLRGEVVGLRGDTLAALSYVTNWYLIYGHKSYFESVGRPSPLQHLWSLAVEEQFYLVWPLLFVAGMRLLRRRGLLLLTLGGTVASTVLMASRYTPNADPSRLYYGTDTRAVALLLGATLALGIAHHIPRIAGDMRRETDNARYLSLLLDMVGLSALAALVVCTVKLDAYAPFLYRGGFALVALAASAVIAAVVQPQARVLPALLGGRVLQWIGVRSYGIYLWHWPVFVITRPHLDVPFDGLPLLLIRLALTVTLAALSYHFVEAPIRGGALGLAWRTLRDAHGSYRQRLRLRWTATVSGIIAASVALGIAVAGAQPAPPPAYLAVAAVHSTSPAHVPTITVTAMPATVATATTVASAADTPRIPTPDAPPILAAIPAGVSVVDISPTPVASVASVAPNALPTPVMLPTAPPMVAPAELLRSAPTTPAEASAMPATAAPVTLAPMATTLAPTAPAPTAPAPAPATPTLMPMPTEPPPMDAPAAVAPPTPHVFAIGDSVMVGAASALQDTFPDIEIDAAVSRQAATTIDILRMRRDAGQLGDVVIVHMGTNGTFTAPEFDDMMATLAGVPRVIFVNLKVPRPWEAADNTVIAAGVQRYPNAVLVDWHRAGNDHPEYFWDDGIHLRPDGAQAYAEMIAGALSP